MKWNSILIIFSWTPQRNLILKQKEWNKHLFNVELYPNKINLKKIKYYLTIIKTLVIQTFIVIYYFKFMYVPILKFSENVDKQ